MSEDVSEDIWTQWFLDAIRKIRSQKQRPSVERICHAIRQHHAFHEDVVAEHLEVAVKNGSVLKVFNKGQSSYKDPGGFVQNRQLKVSKTSDLSRIIAKSVGELGERDGSTLKSIEKFILQSHSVSLDPPDLDLKQLLRVSAKRAVARGLVVQDGKLFKVRLMPISSPVSLKKKESTTTSPNKIKTPEIDSALKVRNSFFFLFYSLLILDFKIEFLVESPIFWSLLECLKINLNLKRRNASLWGKVVILV